MSEHVSAEPALVDPPPRASISVSDIFATAFARYAGGFVTFALIALAAACLPAAVIVGARVGGASIELTTVVAIVAATIAYLGHVGAIVAVIGGRLRSRLLAIVAVAVLAAPPVAAVVALTHLLSPLFLPFVLPMFGLAPVIVGAGDASGLAACRRSVALVTRNGYRRSVGVAAALVALGALLFVGLGIALEPLPGIVRAVVLAFIWGAVYGPLSALVLRQLYGVLTGRLVIAPR